MPIVFWLLMVIVLINVPNAKRQTPNAKRQTHGRIIHLVDAQIASIALVYELVLVTRNTKDFVMIDGLQAVNPF
ncbi:hypothetical protein ACFBZI_01480 [Moraxella sp. ZJ142]|uniref:hypothetical protein n=1 Tax=Moraxella marmotae TaxID=3344520 RepID=UPI0035D40DB6